MIITPEYILQLYQYHYYANRLYIDTAMTLTSEQIHRDQGQSWGSVHEILLHMSNAEWIWLQRWRGYSPSSLPVKQDFPSLPEVITRWHGIEQDVMAYIHGLKTPDLEQEITYRSTQGISYHLPLWQLMVHVPNHATHHRGELAAIFALMAVPHKEDDMLYYFLSQSHQRAL